MTTEPQALALGDALAELRRLARTGCRTIVGIAGAPGAGKSTIAALLADELGDDAVLVPMDGYHLANRELDRLGLRARKGSPETFDSSGYLALLDRLRTPSGGTVYAPLFERDFEESIAGSIAVGDGTPLVITEGNYLLSDLPSWRDARERLDLRWWIDSEPTVRRARLVGRHMQFGKSEGVARAFVTESDERNAEAVSLDRMNATHYIVNS